MGWRAQDARDQDERERWRRLPLRRRYYWGRIAVAGALLALILLSRWFAR